MRWRPLRVLLLMLLCVAVAPTAPAGYGGGQCVGVSCRMACGRDYAWCGLGTNPTEGCVDLMGGCMSLESTPCCTTPSLF
jgi:hypothetical protein